MTRQRKTAAHQRKTLARQRKTVAHQRKTVARQRKAVAHQRKAAGARQGGDRRMAGSFVRPLTDRHCAGPVRPQATSRAKGLRAVPPATMSTWAQ